VTVTRTFKIADLTPEELAACFAEMWAEEQGAFFNEVGKITATWPGTGMCGQALAVACHLDDAGRHVIGRLADHAGVIPERAS
jgi:hypothetical protein